MNIVNKINSEEDLFILFFLKVINTTEKNKNNSI
jgi:hypothetical protein